MRVIKVCVKGRTNRTDQRTPGFGQFNVRAVNFDNVIRGHGLDTIKFRDETISRCAVFGTDFSNIDGQIAHQFVNDVPAQAVFVGNGNAFFNRAFSVLNRALPAGQCRIVLCIALWQG